MDDDTTTDRRPDIPATTRFAVTHSPTTPLGHLVGLADFAEKSGVLYDTVTAYRTRGMLPPPAAMLGRVPVWTRRQLNEWLRTRPSAPTGTL
jgi:hypothetical protein